MREYTSIYARSDFAPAVTAAYEQACIDDGDGAEFYNAYYAGNIQPILEASADCAQAVKVGLSLANVGADIAFTINDAVESAQEGKYIQGAATAMMGIFAVRSLKVFERAEEGMTVTRGGLEIHYSADLLKKLRTALDHPERYKVMEELRPLIDSGEVTGDMIEQLYNAGILKERRQGLKAYLMEKLGWTSAQAKNHAGHHYFPIIPKELDKPLELKFLRAGLDPNDPEYGVMMDVALHQKIHSGKGWGAGGPWNYNWKRFFEDNPEADADMMLKFLNEKMLPCISKEKKDLPLDDMGWFYNPKTNP